MQRCFLSYGGGRGGREETAQEDKCEPLAPDLSSLKGNQCAKAWLWIPHWDGLGPEGMPANLQPALLPENSCNLHLPDSHGGYLREVCTIPPFQERRSFVMTEREEFKVLMKSMWIIPIHFSDERSTDTGKGSQSAKLTFQMIFIRIGQKWTKFF